MNTTTPETSDEMTLRGAAGIYIEEGEWSVQITADEAADMINNKTHRITILGHMIRDAASGVWLNAGTYSVVMELI